MSLLQVQMKATREHIGRMQSSASLYTQDGVKVWELDDSHLVESYESNQQYYFTSLATLFKRNQAFGIGRSSVNAAPMRPTWSRCIHART